MRHLKPYIFIFAIISVIFFPYFKDGRVPIALDIPIGMYYPWYNHTYGYAVHSPVKNPIITDTVSQFWIWRNWGIEGLKNLRLNIWNPYSFSGYEMSPWFHTNILSPLNIFYFFFSHVDAMAMIVISQFFISLIGCFLFGELVFKSSLVGIFLATIWTFSSYFVGWSTWGTISFGLAIVPWILFFVEKFRNDGGQIKWLVGLTTMLVFLILSGHPQTIGYCILIFLIWSTVRTRKPYISWFLILISVLICSPVLLPSLPIVKDSIRSLDSLAGVNFGFIPWGKVLTTLISANFYGNPATGNYFGGDYNFQEKLINFGTVGLIFTSYRFLKIVIRRRISKLDLLGIIFIFLGLILITQFPLGYLIYDKNVPLLSTSPAGRASILIIFGGTILSSLGLKDVVKSKLNIKAATYTLFFVGFILCLTYSLLISTIYTTSNSSVSLQSVYEPIRKNFLVSARNAVYPLMIFLFTVVAVWTGSRFSKLNDLCVKLIVFATLVEGILFFKRVTPFVPKDLYFPKTPSINFLLNDMQISTDLFRVERESSELLPPNMWEVYGIYSTSGYDPIAPRQYEQELIARGIKGNVSRYFENGDSVDLLDELGVKYFLALKQDERSNPSEQGKLSPKIDTQKWKEVFTEGPVSVLKNQNYHPPYFLSLNEVNDTIQLVSKSDNEWVFAIESSFEQDFVIMENYSPNWHATLDGQSTKIKKYSNAFKSINISPGKHTLVITYKNPHFWDGFKYSGVGLLLFFLLVVHVKSFGGYNSKQLL